MNTCLLKKTFSICLLSTVFGIIANAQIIYTDVKPDTLINCTTTDCERGCHCSSSYHLDLNNDGNSDFKIRYYHDFQNNNDWQLSVDSILITPHDGCSVAYDGKYPLAMNPGTSISSSLLWSSHSNLILRSKPAWADSLGNWHPGLIRYLGLKFNTGKNTYYGWARLSVNSGGTSFTIYDYAYNYVPDQSILAGDSGSIPTNIHHIKDFSFLVVSPNAFQYSIRISFSLPQPEKIIVTIYDLEGRIVKALSNEMMSAGNHQLEWNARDENGNELSTGIYFLRIQSADFSQTEKLMVVK